jgi:hypothetical protein
MSRRAVARAVLLLAAAAAVHLGLGAPARRERDQARQQYARERAERARLRVRVAELERRAAALKQAPAADPAAAARELRGALLHATDGLAVGSVQIAATPGKARGVAASGRLAATGRMADVLLVTERLARPASGVLLERVRLAETGASSGEVRLEVEGFSVRGGS